MKTEGQQVRLSAVAGKRLAGSRLDQAAAELFADFSRARLQKWIRQGRLTVDGQAVKPTFRICGGEHLVLRAELEADGTVEPEPIPLDVIYSDEDLIVVNKPAGLVVHPAAGNPDGTLQNALLHLDPQLATLPRAGIVHRLDKETSGVMVVAHSLRAHASLVEQLQQRTMSRIYRAVARGVLVADGTVDAPIGRHPRDRKRMAVVASGRPAVSHYRVLRRFAGATYLEVALESGRTHQIRVHMAHMGHPLVGDPVYGRSPVKTRGQPPELSAVLRAFPRQALHARTLTLTHPASGETMHFQAPPPADFERLLADLGPFAQ